MVNGECVSAASIISKPTPIIVPPKNDSCTKFPFTYWTGYTCACRVGYKYDFQKYQCVPIYFIPKCGMNAYYNGSQCVCQYGFYMDENQNCVFISCPENSTFASNKCVCKPGYS